ncbi:hypothetical protein GWO13_06145 [Candidatus Bathyarchaeota archaeon]|nr:hypothetical protein [Candidatus Bathyarchaeota archaeon]
MIKLKTMEWSERVWEALKRAVTSMPIFIRKRALEKIIKESEENAKKRNSSIVEEVDLVKAAKEKVPRIVRPMCLDALREQGTDVDKYG